MLHLPPAPFLAALAVVSSGPSLEDERPAVRWEPFSATAHDGSPLEGRLGRIDVPEDRSERGGATIEIAFVVYETENPDPGPPLFFLVGGPGGSGVEHAALVATHRFLPLLEHCDVIGIDQRGTGLSVPNLASGPDFAWELPADRALTRDDVVRAQRTAMERCYAHWTEAGVDLDAYHTAESADDLDDVRRALGLEQVGLVGTSYGSHLGLAYLRRHAEHVALALLQKVEGPDQTFKLPSSVHAQLVALGERLEEDPAAEEIPDFVALVREQLARLERQPVEATATSADGSEVRVLCGAYDLQRAIAERLADTRGHVFLPAYVWAVARGDLGELAADALRYRSGDMFSGMAMMMDCSSWWSAGRGRRYERERRDDAYPLSDALSAPLYPETCEGCGSPDVGARFRRSFECDVPTLFVSGELDARTPPSNVEALREGFSNAAHVRVLATGHDSRELLSEAYRELVVRFLHGGAVEDTVIDLGWDRFAPLDWRER